MSTMLPISIFGPDEPEVDLIDQLSGLQRVTLPLTFHQVVSESS